jgi:hypothetical protein
MAGTRFYLPETQAAPVTPPAPSGTDWEHVNGVTRSLLTVADSSTLTTTAYTPDASDHLAQGDACHRSYVSAALAAQTISGNVKGQVQCLEANGNNAQFLTLKILVISQDGTTTRATLLAITRDTTNVMSTSLQNRDFPSTALTNYTCIDGDRLCVEIGSGGLPVAGVGTQGHNASLRFGCNASSGDLPADDTTTATTWRPWIEFSAVLAFFTRGAVYALAGPGGGLVGEARGLAG